MQNASAAIRNLHRTWGTNARTCLSGHPRGRNTRHPVISSYAPAQHCRTSVSALTPCTPFVRNYTCTRLNYSSKPPGHYAPQPTRTSDSGLQRLESLAQSPDFESTPSCQVDRLVKALTICRQIDDYIRRRNSKPTRAARRKAQQEFATAQVAPGLEIARGRRAVLDLLRVVLRDILSIPADSELRKEDRVVFDTAGQLNSLASGYLKAVEREEPPSTGGVDGVDHQWGIFWMEAQDQVTKLVTALADGGYDIPADPNAGVKEKEQEDKFWEIVKGMIEEEKGGKGRGRRRSF